MYMIEKSDEITVIGAGTMGRGITQIAAQNKHKVNLIDKDDDILSKAEDKLKKILNRLTEKEKITSKENSEIISRINFSDDLNSASDSSLIIEAVVEDLSVKQNLFSDLEKVIDEKAILATNTSSLSVTSIASACNNFERVLGTHFFNPAPVLKLVEVIPGTRTSDENVESVFELMKSWNKVPVKTKDTPGFIVNKVARPFYGEALRIYEEGIADFVTIDFAMKSFGGFKMGPFELMDLIGNDVNYKVTETVFKEFYFDPRYKPSIAQKRMVEANLLGRKTNKGFYDYSDEKENPKPDEDQKLSEKIFDRIIFMLINEAADTVHMNIANEENIDLAMKNGVNYPKGLFEWLKEITPNEVVNGLQNLYDIYNEDRYRVSPYLKKLV